jgi:hypothetical protein
LNSTLSAAQLSQQQQQQQPVNLIPNFSNFPFILQRKYFKFDALYQVSEALKLIFL